MISVRRSVERGATRLGWLDSRHTFSFGDYHDPRHMGFGPLRVINEDRVIGGAGFPAHGHRDMEILTWVLDGALAHRDSLGTGSTIGPGELQAMSAGSGIRHSEFNASADAPVHFLQIWIEPDRIGLPPAYRQQAFDGEELAQRFRLIASRDGRDGSILLNQNADLYAARLASGTALTQRLCSGRRAWLQVNRGAVKLDGQALTAGDGAALVDEAVAALTATAPAEVFLFDLP